MNPKNNPVAYGVILAIVKLIYKEIREWLRIEAKKTETPIDDWMLDVLDKILLD